MDNPVMQSSNLDLQRKSCRVVIGLEGVKDGRVCRFVSKDFNFLKSLEMLSSDGYRYYAIIHDKDETEYKHIHLVMFSTKTLRLKQFLNSCVDAFGCDAVNVSVRETTNVVKNIQYLIHKNENETKHKYGIEELMSNAPSKEVLSILQSDENNYDELVSSESLVDIIRFSENVIDMYYKLGYKFINNNVRVIKIICKQYHPDWVDGGLL